MPVACEQLFVYKDTSTRARQRPWLQKALNLTRQITFSLSYLIILIAIHSQVAHAQITFKVGDRVEADPQLLGIWRPATVIRIYMADGAPNGYEIRFDSENNRPPEEYTVGKTEARGIRPIKASSSAANPRVAVPENRSPGQKPDNISPPVPLPDSSRVSAGNSCSSDTAVLAPSGKSESLDLSFKRAILSNYQKRLTETSLSTPLAVGVTYAEFQVGNPRVNRRTLDRLDGTWIRNAPEGTAVYPVRTRFTECEQFRTEIIRTSVDGRYECYRNNFGQWSCSNASGWRTLDTQRQVLGQQ
jgi:hypothetical protein